MYIPPYLIREVVWITMAVLIIPMSQPPTYALEKIEWSGLFCALGEGCKLLIDDSNELFPTRCSQKFFRRSNYRKTKR